MMLLMYDTAARIQEILNVCLCDIRLGKTPTIILHGKGLKIRTVPLMKQTVEHFENYIKIFHSGESEYSKQPLFYGDWHGEKSALDASTVRKMIAGYGKTAREKCADIPPKVHPHLFRHSRAMHLYQHGMDLTLISQWLGHAQLDTTLVYAHADTEQKRKAIELATAQGGPLKDKLNSERYTISEDDILKKLYGLK
jgi:site-specific recombinase XerD